MTWIPVFNDVGTHLYEYYVVCMRYAVRTVDNESCYISCSWDNLSWAGNISSTRHINSSVSRDIPCAFMKYYFVRKKKYCFSKNKHVYTTVSKDRVQNFILSNWIKEIFEKKSQSKYIYTHRCNEKMKRNIAQKCVGCLIQQSISILSSILKFISFISNRNTLCHIKHFNYIL